MITTDKFKRINSNVIENASDSGEEVEEGGYFLKVDTIAILWNAIVNRIDKGNMIEKKTWMVEFSDE